MEAFTIEKKLLQQYVLGYQIDFYFPEPKLAIQIHEKEYKDRNKYKKNERLKTIEK